MSNRKRLHRPPLRCSDCNARIATTRKAGRAIVRVDHDPSCPAWRGTVPSSVAAYAAAEAANGTRVLYVKTPALPEGWTP